MAENIEVETIIVKEGHRSMPLIIPKTGDRSYDDYLKEAEIEKTRDELRKKPPLIPVKNKEQVSGALKEYVDYRNRIRRDGNTKKYY